jgi:hypothetical protein
MTRFVVGDDRSQSTFVRDGTETHRGASLRGRPVANCKAVSWGTLLVRKPLNSVRMKMGRPVSECDQL